MKTFVQRLSEIKRKVGKANGMCASASGDAAKYLDARREALPILREVLDDLAQMVNEIEDATGEVE